MKNKLFETLLPVALFVILGLVFNSNSVNALCKIENETLTIHNKTPGELLEGYTTPHDKYKNIIVTGALSTLDFMDLSVLSYKCESVNIFNVDVENIPPALFRGNSKLKSFIFPKNLKSIGAFSFSNCLNLETAILPNTLEKVGDCAFEDCIKLNLTLSSNVLLGEDAFNGCNNIHFSETQNNNNNNTTTNTPSKNIFSSIISFVYSFSLIK
ncbi:MAG: leucine-rich repeat domain-containing protein [Clostridia bacterium]|nr:leucine-rich repeat domain-containing protein [Clostridia bacterium]